MRSIAFRVAVITGLPLAACSLFVDTSGFDGAGGEPDAGDASAAAANDAGSETTTSGDAASPGTTCDAPRKERGSLEALPVGKWTRVSLTTNFTVVTLKYDDRTILNETFIGFQPSSIELKVGIESFASMAFDVSYDDVACQVDL